GFDLLQPERDDQLALHLLAALEDRVDGGAMHAALARPFALAAGLRDLGAKQVEHIIAIHQCRLFHVLHGFCSLPCAGPNWRAKEERARTGRWLTSLTLIDATNDCATWMTRRTQRPQNRRRSRTGRESRDRS